MTLIRRQLDLFVSQVLLDSEKTTLPFITRSLNQFRLNSYYQESEIFLEAYCRLAQQVEQDPNLASSGLRLAQKVEQDPNPECSGLRSRFHGMIYQIMQEYHHDRCRNGHNSELSITEVSDRVKDSTSPLPQILPLDPINTRFSIVIITCNHLALLKQSLESALNQTQSCEVIVIDNGSKDGTAEFLQTLNHRLIYHCHSFERSYGEAVNLGVKLAGRDWIKLLGDRDYLMPHCVETLSQAIAPFPEAVIASCQAIYVDENQAEIHRTTDVGEDPIVRVLQENIHYHLLLDQFSLGKTTQIAIRKDAFLCAGGWDSSLPSRDCEELDAWMRVAQYGDAVFVNQPLSYCRAENGTVGLPLLQSDYLDANVLLKNKLYPLIPKLMKNSDGSPDPDKKLQLMALEYYHLAKRSDLTESQTSRLAEILQATEADTQLGCLLQEVDDIVAQEFTMLKNLCSDYYPSQRLKILEALLHDD
jgi:GT2 family glycosyltransferase